MNIKHAMLRILANDDNSIKNEMRSLKDFLNLPPDVDPTVNPEYGDLDGEVGKIEDLRMPEPGYPLGDFSPVQSAWDQIIQNYKDKGFIYYKLSDSWDRWAPRVQQYYLSVSKDGKTWYNGFYFVYYSPDESDYTTSAGFDFSFGNTDNVYEVPFDNVVLRPGMEDF
jgi:hypothetical protein